MPVTRVDHSIKIHARTGASFCTHAYLENKFCLRCTSRNARDTESQGPIHARGRAAHMTIVFLN